MLHLLILVDTDSGAASIYRALGDHWYEPALRPPKHARLNREDAEATIATIMQSSRVPYTLEIGEGAFGRALPASRFRKRYGASSNN